ncbi:MAG: pseudouridine-5'-phosphate glycosidase [Bacilli bacterium]|nr:pseudouridine-5'-phosphate glycosidase [Bacilli bacterium]MBN2696171.1 pseudouridine-5'-phosphate glycosidase [Bacilli bacterium]
MWQSNPNSRRNIVLRIHPDIKKAIKKKQPVVALESNLIAHGMPYPQSVETALICERTIRSNGAIPATIAVFDGVITVGLSISEMELLGRGKQEVFKTTRKDLAYVIDQKKTGALTVAAAMIAAKMAGIKVLVTGGIGGVHRYFDTAMDISADVEEFNRTNVCVVSSGVKAILDVPKTLEYLETHGIPVIGYQTDVFPAFYTRESDLPVDFRFDDPDAIASYMKTQQTLKLESGILVANPIPEAFSIPREKIENFITTAVEEGKAKNIRGKALTPYLLERVNELSRGESLEANRRLLYSNCELASKIAIAYAKLEEKKK